MEIGQNPAGVPTREDLPRKPGSWRPIVFAVAGILTLAAIAGITANESEEQVERAAVERNGSP